MNVKDLIEKLRDYPGDMEVMIANKVDGVVIEVVVSDVTKARMKEVYFSEDLDEFLLADDNAFDQGVDVNNVVVLFI